MISSLQSGFAPRGPKKDASSSTPFEDKMKDFEAKGWELQGIHHIFKMGRVGSPQCNFLLKIR